MASGIHSIASENNMNLINEPILYTTLSKEEYDDFTNFLSFEDNRNYLHYSISPQTHPYVNDTRTDLSPLENNNNVIVKGFKEVKSSDSSNSETDESTISYLQRESPDDKGTKTEEKATSDKNDFYTIPCVFRPNLYQPQYYYNKSRLGGVNRHYCRGKQRSKFQKHSEETQRQVHGLMKRFESRAHKLKIDINPQILLNDGPWDSLNQEMWDVFVNKIQKEETYITKLNLWKSIFLYFRVSLSNYGLYLVGSTMSGFALEGSDVDICLLTRPYCNEPRVDSLHHLSQIQDALLNSGIASEAKLIMAKVPILKFNNKESGLDVDLNCNNVVGIQNTRLLYCYAQLDWRVRPLVAIVKVWAQANNINDAKNMTISSYSWTLMVIHFLQCGVCPEILPCLHDLYPHEFDCRENWLLDVQGEIQGLKKFQSQNTRCIGDLLIGFFHYYSYFQFQHYAISVRTASRLPIEVCKYVKSPKNDPHQWKHLCIEEPFDFSNTAKSVFDLEIFKHVKQVLLASYKELACNKIFGKIIPVELPSTQR